MAIFNGNGNDNTIYGGTENDLVNGRGGNDVLFGLEGDDTIFGGAGDDSIFGGSGQDFIQGGAGRDIIYGGAGKDILEGNGGSDALYGDNGADTLNGGGGNDILVGGNGLDLLLAGAGNDYVIGGEGSDTLYGGAGNDRIFGDELVEGTAAAAYNLDASVSADSSGADVVFAGSGNDIVLYDSADISYNGGADFDLIRSTGGVVDLSATDRNISGPVKGQDSGFTGPVTRGFEAIQLKGVNDTVIMHAWNSQDTFDLTAVSGNLDGDHRAVVGNQYGFDKIVIEVNGTISSFVASTAFGDLSADDQAGINQISGGAANVQSYELVYNFTGGSHTFQLHTAGIEQIQVVDLSGSVLSTYDLI